LGKKTWNPRKEMRQHIKKLQIKMIEKAKPRNLNL
jgi:hypothetical protein